MSDIGDTSAPDVVTGFIEAFARFDYPGMARRLAVDARSYVTQPDGGVALVKGRDAYMKTIASVDYASADLAMNITQILEVGPGRVMVMVEIRAARKGRELHNFAAFLIDVRGGQITTMRMVEARPAYSDEFWKA